MPVLRSIAAAGLLALTLGSGTLLATTADAGPASPLSGQSLSQGVADRSAAEGSHRVELADYHRQRCFWEWRNDRWGHRHHYKVCSR